MISDGIDALSKHLSRRLQSIPTDFTLTASDRRLLDLVAFLLMHGKLAGDVKSIVVSRRLRLRRLPVHRDYFLRTLLVVDAQEATGTKLPIPIRRVTTGRGAWMKLSCYWAEGRYRRSNRS